MPKKKHGIPSRETEICPAPPLTAKSTDDPHIPAKPLDKQNEELQTIQQELKASQARFFDLYEQAPVGYVTVNEADQIQQINRSAATLLGMPLPLPIHQPITHIIFHKDQDVFLLARKKLIETGEIQTCELRMAREDGAPVWVHVTLTSATDTAGVPEFRVAMSDITERKQTEAALNAEHKLLRANEVFQRDILNSLTAHIAVLDKTGKILAVNEPWLRYGRENGNSNVDKIGVGANYLDVCRTVSQDADAYATTAVDGVEAVLSGRLPCFTLEYPCDTPAGTHWYKMEVIPLARKDSGAIVTHTDINERKQAQCLLAWEKSALESIVDAAAPGQVLNKLMLGLETELPGALCSVLLLDSDGIHLRLGAAPNLPDDYNHAVDGIAIGTAVGSCGTAAYEKREVIASDISNDPLWADYREFALGHGLRACWSTPIHCSQEKILGTLAIYHREPHYPTAAELEVIGRAVHVISIAIERQKSEDKILQFNAELEQQVEKRTAELQTANHELESFTYSVSHDLRTPLRAVDGFSHMMIKHYGEKLDDEGRRKLSVIRSEAQRMGRLIDDLLAFSRLVRQPIEPSPIHMESMAREIFNELSSLRPERKLCLNLKDLPSAHGSEPLIRQVWINLISNAIKFTESCEVGQIEIGALPGSDENPIYYIKDNGAGFDMRYADKLFGVFQRLHSQEEFSGTGVGLALVQRIIMRHGGSVWATAEIDHGATFHFTLPNQPEQTHL